MKESTILFFSCIHFLLITESHYRQQNKMKTYEIFPVYITISICQSYNSTEVSKKKKKKSKSNYQ